ncbi:MAG: YHS domain-containing protein [Alphaproteobacteria bacterium]|nr:YHS domain-containing protein [Alphaproteobacteria bacterium]
MKLLIAVLAAWLLAAPAWADKVNAEGGAAVRGTDVVAYFTEGKAVAGSPQFVHRWNGAEWRFASAANRDAFAADPMKYAPQYGGFCAWAVSNNYTAPIDPDAWRIINGKLYLNYSRTVQLRWLLDTSGNIAKADGNWPNLSKQ